MIYQKKKDIINRCPIITVDNNNIELRKLENQAKRIIISNVSSIIPHSYITDTLNLIYIPHIYTYANHILIFCCFRNIIFNYYLLLITVKLFIYYISLSIITFCTTGNIDYRNNIKENINV